MNLSQIQSFVALADTGSFTEAACTVHLTQSAVSHALAALENELGITLVERTRKGVVTLTPAGQKIIPHARAMLAQAGAIEQEAKAAKGIIAGKLRVGNTLAFCPGVIAAVLGAFEKAYPDVEVVLFEGTLQEVEEWIAGSLIDVGFVPLPANGPGQESALVTTDELCVVVGMDHRLQPQKRVSARELHKERFIMPKSDCSPRLMAMAGIEPRRVSSLIRYQASDNSTILAMVREGLGITLMARMSLPPKLEGVSMLALDPTLPLEIGLALRSRKMASPATELFIETAMQWARERAALLPTPID